MSLSCAWPTWRRSRALVAAAAAGALLVSAAGGSAAERVIDDERMAREFAAALGTLVDAAQSAADADAERPAGGTLTAAAARTQLETAAGRTVPVPESETLCVLAADASLYDTVAPAIVVVGSVFKCDRCKDWHLGQTASGWIIGPDGLVVTNHHVLDRPGGNHYGVMTIDGEVYPVESVVAADPVGDAAVLRIDTRGRRLPVLALGASAACGDPVTVISHPKGRFYSLTTGVVSRYHRRRAAGAASGGDRPAAVWMSVTAEYAIGSSGGPVLNAAGEVVGMVSRTVAGGPAPPPAAAGAEKPPPAPEQMVFKDCVSAETLRGLVAH